VPVFGNLLEVNRDHLGFMLHCARTYGDRVELRFGTRRIILLNDPADVEEVLVNQQRKFSKGYFYRILGPLLGNGLLTSEGDFWLRQRRLAQPAFHRERIRAYAQTMVSYTQALLENWTDGGVRDLNEDMMQLTLRVVGKTLFDADLLSDARDIGEALPQALRELSAQMTGPEFLLPSAIPTPSRIRLNAAVRRLDPLVFRIIRERRADGTDRGDLLSALLRVQDEDGSRMTDRQLRDEAMTIVLAGHETTAIALSWAMYLLAHHPDTERRLRAELQDTLDGRKPTLENLPQLKYTEAVLNETMRLYPPIFGIGRETIDACEINGYPLPAHRSVYIVPYVIQRDARWFDDPDAFRPERWLAHRTKPLPRFAYFPFGGGPRLCIGQAFAMQEAMLVLSTIIQRWRLEPLSNEPAEMAPALTLRPKRGIRMRTHRAA
jgi:cytochrome P450